MKIDNHDRQDLIQYRLTEAKETQADVELLISNNRLKAAINRIYIKAHSIDWMVQ